ncbi:MAG: lipopolysaccharide biosynthesis protein, partial [Acidobacteriota bacterium]|nr:lipopolysaccharide biosynthesis protein [Acidobacteriota bacterium]
MKMAKDLTKPSVLHEEIELRDPILDDGYLRASRERAANRIRVLWGERRFVIRIAAAGLAVATIIAFLIPKRFTATARLMPPDQGSGTGAALLGAVEGNIGINLPSMAENVLGVKTNGELFVGILKSDTVQDDLIHKFSLQKVYHERYIEDCRADLSSHTDVSVDSKSGIVSVGVIDHDPKRAAAMAQEYVDQLNWMVTHLSTSSAHRERVFLDQRLVEVRADLESAEKQFSKFASTKGAIDIPNQGRAMLASAAALQGQLIAAESELQGFRQIYTDNNARVRSQEARVNELRSALQRLGGANANETSSASELYPSLRQLPLLGVSYADLLRRTKVEEAIFETLTQQDELAKVEEAKDTPTVKVLDSPQVPQK